MALIPAYCPYCQSDHAIKDDMAKTGKQRYCY